MLHTLAKSPVSADLVTMRLLMSTEDDLVLLQDGVLCAINSAAVLEALPVTGVYVLVEDVKARGLSHHISPNVRLIDYTQFVALSVKHPQQMAW